MARSLAQKPFITTFFNHWHAKIPKDFLKSHQNAWRNKGDGQN
ncbi:hypothetical protein HPHPA14_1325 [Helicobacter pylori Hp A-14]|nr:hypothetical protein HPHPA14_1325 [Helicobacter pylori Hp A-14]